MLGLAYQRTQQPGRAREAFAEGARAIPHDPVLPQHLGDLEMGLERYSDAAAAYQRSLQLQPNDVATMRKLAVALGRQGLVSEALTLLTRAHELAPDDLRVLETLGVAEAMSRNWQNAATVLHSLLERDPNNALAHYYVGTVLAALQKTGDALAEARKALELSPQDSRFRELHEDLVRAVS